MQIFAFRFSQLSVEYPSVPCNRTSKSRRIIASYLLVFLQMQLLGAAMLHQHGGLSARGRSLSVSCSDAQPRAGTDSNLLCTVCQIVQHSAVQPATSAQILPSSASVPLLRSFTAINYCSELPATNYGRAPPLA
jgi:hypothetical protein